MAIEAPRSDAGADDSTHPGSVSLGPALRRAWLGYQLRLDAAMTEAGFGERRFPDGRVLRLCSGQNGSTISAIGRELGITRQGAGKVVAHLSDRGYVTVSDSATSGREKSVTLTRAGASTAEHSTRRRGRSNASWRPHSERRDFPDSPLCSMRSILVTPRACAGTYDVRQGIEHEGRGRIPSESHPEPPC